MARRDSQIDDFAEELGKLLGNAQAKAEGWLGQRQQITKTLSGIRDTASSLLSQLTAEGSRVITAVQRARRGRAAGSSSKAAKAGKKPGRRKMSAAARARISAAQKARWAKLRAAQKKK